MTIACGVLNYNFKNNYNELKMIFISLLFLSITNIPGDHMGSRPQVWPQNLIIKKKSSFSFFYANSDKNWKSI